MPALGLLLLRGEPWPAPLPTRMRSVPTTDDTADCASEADERVYRSPWGTTPPTPRPQRVWRCCCYSGCALVLLILSTFVPQWRARPSAVGQACYGNMSRLAAMASPNSQCRVITRMQAAANPTLLDAGVCVTSDEGLHDEGGRLGERQQQRCLPSLICIGGQKCGTSVLSQLARAHPRIDAASGEPHFFDRGQHIVFEQPLVARRGWHRANDSWWEYASRWEYEGGTAGCAERTRFEKTPLDFATRGYGLPEMAALVPSATVIFMLREPGARAYSHFNFVLGGRAYAGKAVWHVSLTVIFDFAARIEGALRSSRLYDGVIGLLGAGLYSRRLAVLRAVGYDCSRAAVILSERFFADPQRVFDEVAALSCNSSAQRHLNATFLIWQVAVQLGLGPAAAAVGRRFMHGQSERRRLLAKTPMLRRTRRFLTRFYAPEADTLRRAFPSLGVGAWWPEYA